MMISRIYLLVLLLNIGVSGLAQHETLNGIIEKMQNHQQNTLQEKVFVHFDRPWYVSGETMWLTVYAMDGYFHQSLNLSKVVYVEILDRQQQPILQAKISLDDGKGHGSLLIPASFDTDHYTIRAYTQWMKNFSADFYFHQTIPIVNVFQRLVEKNTNATNPIDAQFFPEGGHLVEGIESKVAFRVIDSSGKGISFTGYLLNSKADTLIRFNPLKFGIGHFLFTPLAREDYRVVLKEKNGKITSTQFPAIQPIGYTISVTDLDQNQLKVTINSRGINESSPVFLIGHNRQMVKSATASNLQNGTSTFLVNKKDLGEGIIHFTLFNQEQQPVCERLYFNRSASTASLQLTADKLVYEPRSKITLQTKLINIPSPLAYASLSIYKLDTLSQIQPVDIKSYVWLTSELKGTIESPAWYFSKSVDADVAMDNLMLTHGWSKFNWTEVMQPQSKVIRFIPEYRGHIIHAKITDMNSPSSLSGIPAYLSFSDKKVQPYFAHSDSNGRIIFETTHLTGQRKLVAQLTGSQPNQHISIESPFSDEVATIYLPFLKLTERWSEVLTQRSISMQSEDVFHEARVKTTFQSIDSSAFYGNASEQYKLDDYTRFPLLEEVMREYVKGVRVRKKENKTILRVLDARRMTIFENDPLILLDGVPVFNIDKLMEVDPLKIKSIEVMTSRYYLGEFNFEGIISLKTYASDLGGFQLEPNTLVLDYDGLQERKVFYAPRYETPSEQQNRLPDQRNLLLWIPNLTIQNESQLMDAYSSDQRGNFRAVIQGMTATGKPLYHSITFQVNGIHK
jgi:hypothetical protein